MRRFNYLCADLAISAQI